MINQLELEKAVQFRFLILGGIFSVFLTLLAFMLWRNIRFRMTVNRTLHLQKEEIEEKNSQNELLLREIHHRVKNNLQILSSLLSLQADYSKDPNALSAINEGRNRVQSMAFIHQQLYTKENVTSVNMQMYLADLCSHLSDSYSACEKEILISYDLEVLFLDVETAIPLGLIVNELVTNSIKYAFNDREEGHINVKIWINEDSQLCLLVEDNGSGISQAPEESQTTSFGSDLIRVLSKKLRGRIKVRQNQGYSTKIVFERYTKLTTEKVISMNS